MKKLICWFKGHKYLMDAATTREGRFYWVKGCERCGHKDWQDATCYP